MRLLSALVLMVVFILGLGPASGGAAAAPILSCSDVNGDGSIDLTDALDVLRDFGASEGEVFYRPLYDLNADRAIDLADVLVALQQFGTACSPLDVQVANAALSTFRYLDQSAAIADGYLQSTQYIPGHGIHWLNLARMSDGVFNLNEPEGLNYSSDGQLLAVFYVVPMWMPGNEQRPEGFAGELDIWHHHTALCSWNYGSPTAAVAENVTQSDCEGSGGVWYAEFGWMLHLWVHEFNENGIFAMTNPGV